MSFIQEKIRENKKGFIKFIVYSILYLLWLLWLGNFYLLPGLLIIFDLYVTQKVNWTFWKKRRPEGEKMTKTEEWVDGIIFAVIAATFLRAFFIEAYTIPTSSMEKSMLVGDYLFVSKVSYGPKVPNTPVAFPLVHHTLPFTESTPAFTEAVEWPYHRLKGFGDVKRNDVVVFNYPDGDTVASKMQNQSYYQLVRAYGWKEVNSNKRVFGDILHRPVDKREHYIKRCIALPGDSLQVKHGVAFINGQQQDDVKNLQYEYQLRTNGSRINPKVLDEIGVSPDDISTNGVVYQMPLTSEMVDKLKAYKGIKSIIKYEAQKPSLSLFPFDSRYPWNEDNYGPIYVPKKGAKVTLTLDNLPLYHRIIETYEGNKLEVKDGKILINDAPADSYTFKLNYYWMMGDNRHNSADSRYWGFVPEDHVVGKAVFVWFSVDKFKGFPDNIRWKRLFSFVK
ncbi:signal peptidase I [Halosquirtibacter xylanolyticus]|uniref:signal peptidase I n=1 Tax=Halosquirtibacter xylanolyticus TaxID=3374599 RepID=UPI003748EB67|nr:signal peptidase I [Prolixibacteraceae bacterium]